MRALAVPVLIVFLCTATACVGTNVGLNRSFDDVEEEQVYDDFLSPDGFVDRLGEPDEWGNEGEGDRLRMTAVWRCIKGEYRKVTWKMITRERGQQTWQVVDEEVRDSTPAECDDDLPPKRNSGGEDS